MVHAFLLDILIQNGGNYNFSLVIKIKILKLMISDLINVMMIGFLVQWEKFVSRHHGGPF